MYSRILLHHHQKYQFFMREHFYLSPKYNNGQTVYKSHHHWMWNQPNKTTKFEYTSCYLNNTHQDHTSHEVEESHIFHRLIEQHSFGVTICNHRYENYSYGTCSTRN